eukprot:SAG25_NODE_604_length_6583_cov_11.931431_5_plen_106_part_00
MWYIAAPVRYGPAARSHRVGAAKVMQPAAVHGTNQPLARGGLHRRVAFNSGSSRGGRNQIDHAGGRFLMLRVRSRVERWFKMKPMWVEAFTPRRQARDSGGSAVL